MHYPTVAVIYSLIINQEGMSYNEKGWRGYGEPAGPERQIKRGLEET